MKGIWFHKNLLIFGSINFVYGFAQIDCFSLIKKKKGGDPAAGSPTATL